MEISVDWREGDKREEQTVCFCCEESNLKKMANFIKLFKHHPLCYCCDDLTVIQAFFTGPTEEIEELIKQLKKKGCSFDVEEK